MRHDPTPIAWSEATDLLVRAIRQDFPRRVALVSSFGAESVVLLHMIARISPSTPILFNQTGMHFGETLDYQRQVAAELGLTNVRLVRPTVPELEGSDPAGDLHRSDRNACCRLRKVGPLERALAPYRAWITGRKRFQSDTRAALPHAEYDASGRVKLNPLADWSAGHVRDYMRRHRLPVHPLVSQGFPSIGCAPCTTPVEAGEGARTGRWRGSDKSECGIHKVNGRLVRSTARGAGHASDYS